MLNKKILFCLVSLTIFLVSCATLKPDFHKKTIEDTPQVEREFRAAWVATVANIDWPSEPGLPVEKQKQEAEDQIEKNTE